ncbi:hypothetical protein, partial [Anabaena sp. FACHB-83]
PCQTCGLREFWGVSFLALDSSRRQIKDYGGSLLSELGKEGDISDRTSQHHTGDRRSVWGYTQEARTTS